MRRSFLPNQEVLPHVNPTRTCTQTQTVTDDHCSYLLLSCCRDAATALCLLVPASNNGLCAPVRVFSFWRRSTSRHFSSTVSSSVVGSSVSGVELVPEPKFYPPAHCHRSHVNTRGASCTKLQSVPATIPRGTMVYYRRTDGRIPDRHDWLAFEFRHSYLFCRQSCYVVR